MSEPDDDLAVLVEQSKTDTPLIELLRELAKVPAEVWDREIRAALEPYYGSSCAINH
jgi:hypothetical protein